MDDCNVVTYVSTSLWCAVGYHVNDYWLCGKSEQLSYAAIVFYKCYLGMYINIANFGE